MRELQPQTESTLKVAKTDEDIDDITLKKEVPAVGYHKMFRFADKTDKILMVCGIIAAIAVGASMPAFSLLMGNMTDSFETSSSDPDAMVESSKKVMFNFLEIGAGVFVACWIMMACWMISG
jgi:ATP-binding cassette subfamily B (MDR/TAP) protein 1